MSRLNRSSLGVCCSKFVDDLLAASVVERALFRMNVVDDLFGCRLHCVCLCDFNNRFANGDWTNRCLGFWDGNKSARFEDIFYLMKDVVVADVFHHFAYKRKALGREIARLKEQVLCPGCAAVRW